MKNRASNRALFTGITLALLVAGTAPSERAMAEFKPSGAEFTPSVGRGIYIDSCAFCHGAFGYGDGEASGMLDIQPTDLTKLMRNNRDEFPWRVVYETIDGRGKIRSHSKLKAMPAWGKIWTDAVPPQYAQFGETYVKGKILEVMMYLNSIQE